MLLPAGAEDTWLILANSTADCVSDRISVRGTATGHFRIRPHRETSEAMLRMFQADDLKH